MESYSDLSIDLDSPLHVITLIGDNFKGVLNVRSAYGFSWGSENKLAYCVKRTDLIFNQVGLIREALREFFDVFNYLKSRLKPGAKFIFNSSIFYEKLENDSVNLEELIPAFTLMQKNGFNLEFINKSTAEEVALVGKLNRALNYYETIDDFNNDKVLFTTGTTRSMDIDLLDQHFNIYHITSPFFEGQPGIKKLNMQIEDLSNNDDTIKNIYHYPTYAEKINDIVRRLFMMIKMSDIIIIAIPLVNPVDETLQTFEENWAYLISKHLNKNVILVSVSEQKKYRLSSSEKRELVSFKKRELRQALIYKKATLVCSHSVYVVGHQQIKKLLIK